MVYAAAGIDALYNDAATSDGDRSIFPVQPLNKTEGRSLIIRAFANALDAEGNLIGVNFDRVWEGTMSDVVYDPEICRNISIDIRYALFIIDKLAGANHLLDEMEILK